ncbi:Aldo/keto reductase [Fomitiporia mediterranea MF3/22]|uniref:Aldo/keto reductase n=1 Tax=Fomitiporia mediterranea (strain MF3/22) TaxID=694068 RepID=UPI0004408F7B|nr:Aldo/keto reductase [Fomitiporia mediterranea MF3/22]EJD07799.1 Aldo/keto reductase [Fomitiporia mediterranea MF3/22]
MPGVQAGQLTLQSTVKLSSGYDMPVLGLGVYQNYACIPACEAALRHGYRLIDTAQMYRNEADVGRAVKDSGIPREEIYITTKISQKSHGYDSTLSVVEESLSKLGVSYIDLYLIHSPLSGRENRLATYRALLERRDAGKIRSVGVSNYGVRHLEELHEAGLETPSVNQIELHPFCQQKDIVEYCTQRGIVVQAYCPLIRADFSSPILQRVAKNVNKDPAQVLVRWSLQRGFVPLPKSSVPERVVSNANVFDLTLSDSDMAMLDALDKGSAGAVSWNPVNAP